MIDSSPFAMAVAAGASLVLIWAAVSDVRARIIPNRAVLALLALALVWAAVGKGAQLIPSLEAFGIALALTIALYAFGIVGAGDSKLFAVTALFMGMGYLPLFALATALAGGAIAAVSLVTRPQRAAVMFALKGRGDFGRGVPYGVAIAIGGMAVMWSALAGALPPYGYGKTARVNTHDLARVLAAPPVKAPH